MLTSDRSEGDGVTNGNVPIGAAPVSGEVAEIAPQSRLADVADPSPQDVQAASMVAQTIDAEALAGVIEQQEPPDAADTLEALDEEQAAEVLEKMEDEIAAEALAEMQKPLATGVITDLVDEDPAYAGRLLELMSPDDAADLLQALPDQPRGVVLASMTPETRRTLAHLAKYDRESAGGLMTTEFLALKADMTVPQAIEYIRAHDLPEDTQTAMIVDAKGHLVGVLGLQRLLLAKTAQRLSELMNAEVDFVRPEMDREHVARVFDRYDYALLPVVDHDRRLLGVITFDDVIDIIREEQTEDTQKMVGAGAVEAVYSSLGTKVRSRFPWLLVNLFTSTLAAIVVLQFEGLIGELAVLAVLMPVIANQAGNAGQQSLAVTLRGIVLDEIRPGRVTHLLLREAGVGLFNGLVAGALVGTGLAVIGTFFTEGASWRLGLIAGLAMMGALTIGCFVGSAMPITMRRLGFDPATGSTIFLTMTTDTVSFFTFLGLASMLSSWLLQQA